MLNQIFQDDDKGIFRVNQRILEEVIDEDYIFHIYVGDEERVLYAKQIQLKLQGISYSFNENDIILPYSEFKIQVFPKGKRINIIKKVSLRAIVLLASLPLLISILLLLISIEPSQSPPKPPFNSFFEPVINSLPINKAEIRGFAFALLVISYVALPLVSRYSRRAPYRQEIRAASSSSRLIEKLEDSSGVEEYFSRLIQVNLRNMEQYYLLVRNQTEKSYQLTQFAAFVGFLTLVAGILLSFVQGLDSPSTVVTIASGALIEFISAVFFYIYNRTVSQLNKYHEKLINVQDTMLALKVAQIVKNGDLKDETMAYLTKALTNRLTEEKETSLVKKT